MSMDGDIAAQANRVSIAVIGTGVIGPRHAKSVVECPTAELLCIVDPASQARAVAETFGIPRFVSIAQMLEQGLVPDAAMVCTPNSTHVSLSLLLFAAGIHVLVEKPISTAIVDGNELLQAAHRSGKTLMVGHHRRFNPYVTAAKQALSAGIIGRPIAISGLWATYKPQSYFEGSTDWRAKAGSGECTCEDESRLIELTLTFEHRWCHPYQHDPRSRHPAISLWTHHAS